MAKNRLPKKAGNDRELVTPSSVSAITAFLKTVKNTGTQNSGRLIFSLDATMSRQPTWDMACSIQGEMFTSVSKAGGLNVQLVYFRGFGECQASKWVGNANALGGLMTGIDCRGGQTQIAKVLAHTNKEHSKKPVSAMIFIGDAMEENIDRLCQLAGELGLKGVKLFMFLEGRDALAERAFREIARLSGGAFLRFDANSAKQLADLLSAIAVYASGGHKALEASTGPGSKLLLKQLNRKGN